ncbi:MAG: Gx transporter family protein [Acholeplasma sp.]|nr:Gx transporter family protein [Acholeplasma sp.]
MSYNKNNKIKKMVLLANLTAAAIILNIIEAQLEFLPVPGARLGLANLITIVVLYMYGFKEGFLVTILRVFIVALLSGRLSQTFWMSMAGGILSVSAMGLLKKFKMGIVLVSLLGSIFHQIGQIVAGIYVIGATEILYYLYIMIPIGVVTGIINGIIGEKLILNLKNKEENDNNA